jgi:hypothetical protein
LVTLPARRHWLGTHRGSVAAAAAALVLILGGSVLAITRDNDGSRSTVITGAAERDERTTAEAVARLRLAMNTGDKAAIADAATDLRRALARLDPSDRRKFVDAERLLELADKILAGPDTTGGTPPTDQTGDARGPPGTGPGTDGQSGNRGPGANVPPSGNTGPSAGGPPPATTPTSIDDHGGASTTVPTSSTTSTSIDDRGGSSTTEPDDHGSSTTEPDSSGKGKGGSSTTNP